MQNFAAADEHHLRIESMHKADNARGNVADPAESDT